MFRRALVAVWIAVAIVSRSAPVRADAAEVEALIAKGNELRRAGTPGPALPYFQKAYELARTPRTTGQLGLAELAAGYPVEAETHLSAALASPNDPSIVKYRQILADALSMARSQLGELTIQGNPPGADVIVNGHSVGTLPLPLPIKLPARNTEIVVRAPGYSDAARDHADRRRPAPFADREPEIDRETRRAGARGRRSAGIAARFCGRSNGRPPAASATPAAPATTIVEDAPPRAPHPVRARERRPGSSEAARSWPPGPASRFTSRRVQTTPPSTATAHPWQIPSPSGLPGHVRRLAI